MAEDGTAGLLGVSDALKQMAERVPKIQAGLVMVVLAAVVALPVAGRLNTGVGVVLAVGVIVLLLVVSALIYRLALREVLGPGDIAVQNRLNGLSRLWRQVIEHENDPGVTIIEAKLDPRFRQHSLTGTRYELNGKKRSTFHSDAMAVDAERSVVEILYRWQGRVAGLKGAPPSAGDTAGLGQIHFRDAEHADGWYAPGDIRDLKFGNRRNCHYLSMDKPDELTWRHADQDGRAALIENWLAEE